MAELLVRRAFPLALRSAPARPLPQPPPPQALSRAYATKARTTPRPGQAGPASRISTATDATPPPPTKSPPAPPSKVETLPFTLKPDEARHLLDTAASGSYGFFTMLSFSARRLMGSTSLPRGLRRVAMQPMLLPTWRVDLAMRGKGTFMGGEERIVELSTQDATLAGFKLDPLHRLNLRMPWSGSPGLFDPVKHPRQLLGEGQEITVLPFEVGPVNLLAKLATMPKLTQAKHGIDLNPATLETTMLALYPLYLPVYLAEYELNGKRVTVVVFGAPKDKNRLRDASASYCPSDPMPQWRPPTQAAELKIEDRPISYFPRDDKHDPTESCFKKIRPQLTQLLESWGKEAEGQMFGDRLVGEEKDWSAGIRVMRYSKWAEANREYMDAVKQLATFESATRYLKLMNVSSATKVSRDGSSRTLTYAQVLTSAEKSVGKARKAVELSKPAWVDEEIRERESRRSRGRGR